MHSQPLRSLRSGPCSSSVELLRGFRIIHHVQYKQSAPATPRKSKRTSGSPPKWEQEVGSYARAVVQSKAVIDLGRNIKAAADDKHFDILSMPKPDVNSVDSIGGRAVFVRIFVRFYARLFKDPVMLQLFNETPEVRPPEEHGELLAAFLLEKIGHSAKPTYTELRGDGKGHGVGVAHTRASQCPMRPRNHQGRGFTFDQGHAWLGNLHHACGEMGVPDFFRDLLLQWLAVFLKSYAPFIDAHQEGNDPGRTCERRQIEGIGHQKEDSETRADQAFRALVLQIN